MTANKNKNEAILPWFPGFYNSFLDDLITQEIEMRMEEEELTYEELEGQMNYSYAFLEIAKGWLCAFNKETGLDLKYVTTESPKEYNFTTDRLVASVTPEDSEKLKKTLLENRELFDEVVRKHFTSRDGFMSFYSNDIEDEEWENYEEYDHNQMMVVLEVFLLANNHEQDEFTMNLLNESCVYEAANAVWV